MGMTKQCEEMDTEQRPENRGALRKKDKVGKHLGCKDMVGKCVGRTLSSDREC